MMIFMIRHDKETPEATKRYRAYTKRITWTNSCETTRNPVKLFIYLFTEYKKAIPFLQDIPVIKNEMPQM
jgi:hypothetical protein